MIVGFLGAGKTTLLKKLTKEYIKSQWQVQIVLNDYENANLDAQQFLDLLDASEINSLSGSCICCSGIHELRALINAVPKRENGITLIEANGTSDACTLMEFLGVGIKDHFLPPVQVSVVDVRNWQARGNQNELEANQIEVSSLVVLNHCDSVSEDRIQQVRSEIRQLNPKAQQMTFEELNGSSLIKLKPNKSSSNKMDHLKAHWSSCSIDLPEPITKEKMGRFMAALPDGVLRAKGCTRLEGDDYYTFFDRIPSGEVTSRRFHANLLNGPQLVVVGPESQPEQLKSLLSEIVQ